MARENQDSWTWVAERVCLLTRRFVSTFGVLILTYMMQTALLDGVSVYTWGDGLMVPSWPFTSALGTEVYQWVHLRCGPKVQGLLVPFFVSCEIGNHKVLKATLKA
jgi:hypothetical protein